MTHAVSSDAPADVNGDGRAAPDADLVTAFLAAWGELDVETAIACFQNGARRHETTTRSDEGGQAVRDYLAWGAERATSLDIEVHGQIAIGGLVVNERTERWTFDDREVVVPTIGLFEVENGRIVGWSDATMDDLCRQVPVDAPSIAPVAETLAADIDLRDEIDDQESLLPISSPIDAVETLEAQLHEWRRRATIWRERALAAYDINNVLRANVDDLRALVRALESAAKPPQIVAIEPPVPPVTTLAPAEDATPVPALHEPDPADPEPEPEVVAAPDPERAIVVDDLFADLAPPDVLVTPYEDRRPPSTRWRDLFSPSTWKRR